MTTHTCGEALVQLLEAYGVETVFGIPGVHTLELYRGLAQSQDRDKIHHVVVRNEQGAGFMADGYARVSGKPGVCILISGPGVTNAATPLGQAYADSIPLLLISSTNASRTLGKGWGCLHEISDQRAVTAPLTALSAVALSPSDVPDLLRQAFTIFASRRPRPVHLSVPIDVLAMPVNERWQACTPPKRPMPHPQQVQEAATLLMQANRPLILVGGGAVNDEGTITQIAEHTQASVITSNAGKGIVPDSHPLNLGASIWRTATQQHVAQADLVLAIGTELSETDSFIDRLPIQGKLIRVDLDPSKINDLYPATLGIVADATETAKSLLAVLSAYPAKPINRQQRQEIAQARQQSKSALNESERQLLPLLHTLRQAMPADTIVMGDISQITYAASYAFPVEQPRLLHYPAGYCTLGCALPGAIGAKLALPQRPVAVLVGDGGFMFTLQELMTAVELRLPIPILLWNNRGFGEIRDGMRARNIPLIGVTPANPDFVQLAKAFGAYSVQPTSLDELSNVTREAFQQDRPTLIVMDQSTPYLHASIF